MESRGRVKKADPRRSERETDRRRGRGLDKKRESKESFSQSFDSEGREVSRQPLLQTSWRKVGAPAPSILDFFLRLLGFFFFSNGCSNGGERRGFSVRRVAGLVLTFSFLAGRLLSCRVLPFVGVVHGLKKAKREINQSLLSSALGVPDTHP